MKRIRSRRNLPEIELTPLIDVLFMLIVFFVLTAVFSEPAIRVNLPSATGEQVPEDSLTLILDTQGRVFIGDREFPREQAIERALSSFGEGKRILVAADREAPYGLVVSLLDDLRESGIGSAGLLLETGEER